MKPTARITFFVTGTLILGFVLPWVGYEAQAQIDSTDVRKEQLKAELMLLELEINKERESLMDKQREAASLERDVGILTSNINKSRLEIRARDIAVSNLLSEIDEKGLLIESLDFKMEREKQSLGQLMRKTNEIDEYSLVEVMLAKENLSDFFIDVDSFESIKQALNQSFTVITTYKNETAAERARLEEKRLEEVNLRQIQDLEKRRLEIAEAEKQELLEVTKGEEAKYQSIIASKEQSAAEIRAALFALRGTQAIPFEQAYSLAKRAERQTGVRPAFLLGLIATESNLGENVGTGNWIDDMHPTRDRPVFEDIAARLGLDPNTLPVSKKPWYGWGGAMGPAQFIPSTWTLYEDEIAALTGHNPPSPWNPEDAFMAAAVLLEDNGAAKGGYANERLAALRYLAGWKNAEKPSYAFYGDDVMALAGKYQRMIDILIGD
jgi:hypothetical protein